MLTLSIGSSPARLVTMRPGAFPRSVDTSNRLSPLLADTREALVRANRARV